MFYGLDSEGTPTYIFLPQVCCVTTKIYSAKDQVFNSQTNQPATFGVIVKLVNDLTILFLDDVANQFIQHLISSNAP